MTTRSIHVVATIATLVVLLPTGLMAQIGHDVVPLTSWPAPLYFQPTRAESPGLAKADTKPDMLNVLSSDATALAATPAGSLVFVAMTPCRVVDTRPMMGFTGAFGPPGLIGGGTRTFPVQSSTPPFGCSIPSIAQAYSFNVTIVPPGFVNWVTVWPTGQAQPNASTLNGYGGTVIANAAIVPAGTSGSVDVFASNNTDLIIDINGYYAPQSGITLVQGTAAAPSMSFAGDAGTGIYSAGAGTLNVATGGTNRLTIAPNGVGVSGNATVVDSGSAGLRVQTNASGGTVASFGSNGDFQIDAPFVGGGRFVVKEGGNVGIGTSNPGRKLHVSGNGILRSRVNSDSNAGLELTLNNQPGWSVATVTPGQFQIFNDALGQNAAWIDKDTNRVGIGTTNPVSRLHVSEPGINGLRVETLTSGGTVASFGGKGLFLIDSNGYPGGRLEVLEDGRVHIGLLAHVENPPDELSVDGNIRVNSCLKEWGGAPIAGFCLSDERLKRNIVPFEPALEKLAQVRPVHFDWRSDEYPELELGSSRSYGLIAQEVGKVLPEMVTEDPHGFKTVNYSELPLFLLQAIRELKAENDNLRQERTSDEKQFTQDAKQLQEQIGDQQKHITDQKEQNRKLEERLAALEALLSPKTSSTTAGQ